MIKPPKHCKGCIYFTKRWANFDGKCKRIVSGYWCCANGGKRIKTDKKQCEDRKEER